MCHGCFLPCGREEKKHWLLKFGVSSSLRVTKCSETQIVCLYFTSYFWKKTCSHCKMRLSEIDHYFFDLKIKYCSCPWEQNITQENECRWNIALASWGQNSRNWKLFALWLTMKIWIVRCLKRLHKRKHKIGLLTLNFENFTW